ncbi:MAG: ABC transporter substrate-binding protein, partial [Actinomycetota bacterium]
GPDHGAGGGEAGGLVAEQASGQDLGPGSDVYSIGVVLYELLSGTLPFTDVATFGALIRQHLTEPPRPLLQVAPDVPARVAAAVDRALMKDPTQRWESAAAFGIALGEATSQAFGAAWPRQRRFSLSGAPEILAATEREVGGDPRPGSVHVAGEPSPSPPPVTGAGMAAPTAASTSGEQPPPSTQPPVHPTTAPPAAPAPPVPAPTAEVRPPSSPDQLPTTPGPAGPAGPPPAPNPGVISGDWAPPAAATTPVQPLASPGPPATGPGAPTEQGGPRWPAPGPPVADHVAGPVGAGGAGGGGGPAPFTPSNSGGGGRSKTPLILGGAAVGLLGLLGVVGITLAGGDDDAGPTTTVGEPSSTSITEATTVADPTTDPTVGTAGAGAFVLGTLIDDGEFANDDDQQVSIDLAIDDIEAAGGVLGQPMVVLPGPYTDDTGLAITAGAHLAGGASAIVGPTDPVDTDDVVDVVTAGGAVLMSPTDFFARDDSSGLYFQTRVPNTLVGEAAASLVAADADEVVLIRPSGSFLANEGVIQAVIDRLDDQGTDVSVVDIIDEDYAGTAAEVASLDPDAVMVYAVIDKTSLYAALIAVGLRPAELPWIAIGDDGGAIDSGDGLIAGVQGVTVDFLTGDTLEERLPATSLSSAAAQAYDAVIILALAAEQAGSPDGTAIAEHLPLVTGEGERCTTFAACKELIAAGTDIDYVGPGGSYDLSPTTGRPESGYFQVSVVGENGFSSDRQRLDFNRNQ